MPMIPVPSDVRKESEFHLKWIWKSLGKALSQNKKDPYLQDLNCELHLIGILDEHVFKLYHTKTLLLTDWPHYGMENRNLLFHALIVSRDKKQTYLIQ